MESLFDIFGINPKDAMTEAAKKEEKKKTETKKSSTKKNTKKKEVLYKLPLKVVMGYLKPIEIESVEDKSEISEKEIKDIVSKKLSVKAGLLSLEVAKDQKTVYAAFSKTKEQVKGKVKVTPKTRFVLPEGKHVDASSLLEECEGEVVLENIKEALASNYGAEFGFGISLIPDGEDWYVRFAGNALNKVLSFPLGVALYGRGMFKVTQEQWAEYEKANGKEDDSYDKSLLISYIAEKYPDIAGHISLQYIEPKEDTNTAVIDIVNVNLEVAEKVAVTGKTEVLFPTNAKLWVMAQNPIQLEPSMFDGKEEVNEDEIIKYAHENVSPIFKKGRCLAEFFKEDNFVYLTMKGSKKGAIPVVATVDEYYQKTGDAFSLFEYVVPETGARFMVEKNPANLSIYNTESGTGILYSIFGKLPEKIYEQIRAFFSWVAKEYDTEVLVRVCFNTETNSYEVDLPYQQVTDSSVHELDDDKFGVDSVRYVVGEFHSHCHFDAFFSSTDDEDECMALIYGVFGAFNGDEEPKFIVRSCANGNTFPIRKETVFDGAETDHLEIEAFVDEFKALARQRLIV